MTTQELLEKQAQYEVTLKELEAKDFTPEIEAKVAEFKAQLDEQLANFRVATTEAFEADKKADITKVQHYLSLLEILIAEAREQELAEARAKIETTDAEHTEEAQNEDCTVGLEIPVTNVETVVENSATETPTIL